MFLGAPTLDMTTALGVGRFKLATVLAMVAAANVARGILSSMFLVLKKWCLITLLACVGEDNNRYSYVVGNTLSKWKPKNRHSCVLEATSIFCFPSLSYAGLPLII